MISEERLKAVLAENESTSLALKADGMNADEYLEMAGIARELLQLRASHRRLMDALTFYAENVNENFRCAYLHHRSNEYHSGSDPCPAEAIRRKAHTLLCEALAEARKVQP